MKKTLFLLFQFIFFAVNAQDYFTGKLIDKNQEQKEIFYDRTQNDISASVFQTVYKIFDADKKPLYTVTLTHDRFKAILFISIKTIGADPSGRTVTYDKSQCGLIFSDAATLDTSFNITSGTVICFRLQILCALIRCCISLKRMTARN